MANGLLDQVNYTGGFKPISVNTPSVPEDEQGVSFQNNFQTNVPESTLSKLYDNVKQTSGIATEGIQTGNDAADALFNSNTTAFSRALSARANKMMSVGKSTHTLNSELQSRYSDW